METTHRKAAIYVKSETRCLLLAVVLILLLGPKAGLLRAQDQDGYLQSIGIPTYTATLPVENGYVKLANGALHLEIPLVSAPQRGGHQFKATLVFDSNIWNGNLGVAATPINIPPANSWQGNSLAGWRIVTSADVGYTDNTELDYGNCQGAYTNSYYQDFVWYAPDGTSHGFDFRTQEGWSTPCGNGSQYNHPLGGSYALDSSGYYMASASNFNITVRAPDGTQVYPKVEDSNGNYYMYGAPWATLSCATWYGCGGITVPTVTDSLGRTLLTGSVSGSTIYIYVLNTQGTTSKYTITTALIPLNAQFPWSSSSNYTFSGYSITGIQSVQLPDNTSYTFKYDCPSTSGPICGSTGGGYNYGELTSMTLPTGGQVKYSYSTLVATGSVDTGSYYQRMLTSRTTPDSTTPWTYAVQWNAAWWTRTPLPLLQTFTATKPNGDTDVYTLTSNGGLWPTTAQYYTGSASQSNLIATINQVFNFTTQCSGGIQACSTVSISPSAAINVTKSSQTTTLPLTGSTSVSQTTNFSWDSGSQTGESGVSLYGELLQRSDWNFGSLLTNPADRTTTYTYLNGSSYLTANILDRPASITVTNGSGATVTKTVNCYDYAGGCGGSAFGNAGTITNHDTNYGTSYAVRGDLTQTQKLVSGSTYLTQSMTYDTAGQLLSKTDWTNLSTHATTYSYTDSFYNDAGDGSNPTPNTSNPATGAYPTTITYPTVNSVTLTENMGYYWGTGQKALSTDANGQSTYFHFSDPLNRPTSSKLPNLYNGTCCGWTYNVYPNASETQVDSGIGIVSTTRSVSCTPSAGDCRHDQKLLDGLGRTSSQILVSDPDGQDTVGTTYDSNSRVYSVSNPHRLGSLPTDGTEYYAYDGLDRKIQVTRPDGSIAYRSYGAQIGSNGRSSQLCSGFGVGFPVLYKDEAARLRQTWTDGFGRLIEVDEPDPTTGSLTSGAYAGTCYAYDLNNNLVGVLQPGSEATCTLNSVTYNRCFTYDMLSRLTQATNPESGTISYSYTTSGGSLCSGDLSSVCFRVAPLENQASASTTVTTTYSYDALNRLTSKSYNDSNPTTPTITYGYDAVTPSGCTPPSLTIAYGKGHRTSMCDGAGATSWSFDQVGNILIAKRITNNVPDSFTYIYNLDSTVGTVGYPTGRTITYQPGDAQRPLWGKDVTNGINYATGAHYFPPGELASLTNGSSINFTAITNNRLQPCWQYATTGTALSWSSTSCTTTETTAGNILDLEYGFNFGSSDNGNVIGITNNKDTTRSQAFTYDYRNRIKTAETTSTYSNSPTHCWSELYSIDTLGNLTSIAAPSGTYPTNPYAGCTQESGFSTTMNSQNQDAISCYDAAGNKVGAAAASPPYCSPLPTTYSYNAEDQLISTAGVTYSYDGDGKRVQKSNGTLYWYGTRADSLLETSGSGSLIYEYVFFGEKRTARRDSSSSIDYYFSDELGTSRVVANASGTILDDSDFYPYGGERPVTGPSSGNHYKFTGKERDSESGLDDFGARYYSSQYGRFSSVDLIWVKSDRLLDPQRLNLYSYTRNNPVSLTDPTGMDVRLRGCPADMTTTMCEAAIKNGLRKADRDHVHFVEGNGKNGYNKGEIGITVDTNYQSNSLNYTTLQSLANDHTALARIDILDPTDTYKFRVDLSYPPKGLSVVSSQASDFGGFTFLQYRGKEEPGILYSTGDFTNVIANAHAPGLDLGETTYHELQHVFLGDFGRSALNAAHGLPEVERRTKAAEKEASDNEKDQ
jgi:RHS repeat-associated protein